jgi:hypothetical protein
MLLIIEITLAVAAWKNGWGARALLPLLGALGLAFFAGVVIGASQGSMASARVIGLLLDLGAIAALGVMACKAPRADTPELQKMELDSPVPLSSHSHVSGD